MVTQALENISEFYQDRELYSSPDMFSPPAERLPQVIRFELTKGCDWARCTYCGGYDGVKHEVKDMDEYKNHVDRVWEKINENPSLRYRLRRIFIGGGNALEVETEILNEAIQYTENKFMINMRIAPRRISLYGRTIDILRQSEKGLKRLSNSKNGEIQFSTGYPLKGLGLIYWGVESGSTKVLDYVNKGCTKKEILRAAKIVNKVPIKTSVMIMPGLGGKRFYDEHIKDTAKVLGKIKPAFLTFMGVNPPSESLYIKRMLQEEEDGKNRPLTSRELSEQMIEIIARMPFFRTRLGCFGGDIDGVGYNPLSFGSYRILDCFDKNHLVWRLKEDVKNLSN